MPFVPSPVQTLASDAASAAWRATRVGGCLVLFFVLAAWQPFASFDENADYTSTCLNSPMRGLVPTAFYCQHPFHRAMLEEAYQHARASTSLAPHWVERAQHLVAARPRIVVYANTVEDDIRAALSPETLYVFTRHGFSSKHWLAQCLRSCDAACVSSEWVAEDHGRRYCIPPLGYWVTGFPATDALWRNRLEMAPAPGYTTLLYAPTWSPTLSAHPVIGTAWAREWLRPPGRRLIVKLHPHVARGQPDWVAPWNAIRDEFRDRVKFPDADENIYALMPMADLLLSDASSTAFYWLALDRPVVLVDPQPPEGDERFDPEGPEWTWRDMGPRVTRLEELLPALMGAHADPEAYAAQRRVYRDRLYGDLFDGNASARLAARLSRLAEELDA